jgi:CIC family chloride channel protein
MTRTPSRFRPLLRAPANEVFRLALPVVIVGVGSGLGAVAFRHLIELFTQLFFHDFARWTTFAYPFNIVAIPALGALLFGPMIFLWAREARGHGVPEVMEAVALRGGRIRPVVAVVKSLASSINIGSGGSVGREGPIAQIGSALGSTLGQVLKLQPRYLRLLVAAGAAGGISATFNAPIAGAIFAMEVILREFTPEAVASTGLAAVLADVTALPFLGSKPFFLLPAGVGLHSPYELLLFVALGLTAAVVGTTFTRFLYALEDLFNAWRLSEAIKPALGAVLLGVLIAALPPVRGLGYSVMAQVFEGHLGLGRVAVYLGGKFLATSLTLGSGGSGGIFTPTLYLGTMLGDVVGVLGHMLWPGTVGPAAGYALVGAAAVFAAASRAPITAVIIVMEMSQNYVLAIPLVLATVVATRTSDFLLPDSIYTLKLVRRGVRLFQHRPVDVLEQVTVRQAMVTGVASVAPDAAIAEATHRLMAERRTAMPVEQGGRLMGIVTVSDLERAHETNAEAATVADVMVSDVVVAYPDEPIREAVRRLNRSEVGQLLVVEPERPDRMIGLLRRVDVVKALEVKLGDAPAQDAPPPLPAEGRDGAFVRVVVPERARVARKELKDVRFPAGVVVVSVTRGERTLVPNGGTVIMPDDQLLLYVVPASGGDDARRFVLGAAEAEAAAASEAPRR